MRVYPRACSCVQGRIRGGWLARAHTLSRTHNAHTCTHIHGTQSWTEEAGVHYLNMQGYHVPLNMQDSILEEDAAAIAAQDAAVKYGGQLSKDALARNPPIISGLF